MYSILKTIKDTFIRFKAKYKQTIEAKRQSFMFEGNKFLTDYAKYVIEYLQPKFYQGGADDKNASSGQDSREGGPG